jgi:hypothetical protein
MKPYSLVVGMNNKPAITSSPISNIHTQTAHMLLVNGKKRKKFLRL